MQTRADKIKSMTNEELRNWLCEYVCDDCFMCPVGNKAYDEIKNGNKVSCKDMLLKWLEDKDEN